MAIHMSASIIQAKDIMIEQEALRSFFDKIGSDDPLICFGNQYILNALETGAIDRFLVWEKFDQYRVVRQNKQTNAQVVSLVKKEDLVHIDMHDHELVETKLFMDWLNGSEDNRKRASVQVVSDATPEGKQFVVGFGGLAAFLRYEFHFDPLPMNSDDSLENDQDFKDMFD